MKYNKTVVTACDSNYIWGAFLLIASLCYSEVKSYKKVLGIMLTDDEQELLTQFPDTEVINSNRISDKSVCLMKPHAMQTAETDIICWMDSDCIVTGDVTDLIEAKDGEIQIRFRSLEENAGVYRNYYGRNDEIGLIPQKVLDVWKSDVDDLEHPQIITVGQTNCFVITKNTMDFVDLWQIHMGKVIVDNALQVYDKKSIGYFMTDESALNSLMAFSSKAPKVKEYLFDQDEDKLLVHFGLNPKPWVHWTKVALPYYDLTLEIIDWCLEMGYKVPPIPSSFNRKNKMQETVRAEVAHQYRSLRYGISTFLQGCRKRVRL